MLGPGIRFDNYRNSSDNKEDKGEEETEEADHGSSGSRGSGGENQGFSHHHNNNSSLFSFDRLNFGQKVTLNEVYAIVERTPGVDFVVVRKFCRRSGRRENATAAVQEIINTSYNEILQCENDPLDPIKGTIKVIARGGVEL
jgi:hypothetical protein